MKFSFDFVIEGVDIIREIKQRKRGRLGQNPPISKTSVKQDGLVER